MQTKTTSELEAMLAEITTEVQRRAGEAVAELRYSQEWGGYNQRRYGRPWIARVTSWPVGGLPELVFGGYCGDNSGGETEIMAKPGDIIRSGRKDHRGNNTSNDWYEAMPDGSLRNIDQAEARKLYH